jgi:aryl-alcohol dehydrogenase-like predicted oxidoreductase
MKVKISVRKNVNKQLIQKRPFGRSGHLSSIAIFGGAAFWDIPREEADHTMQELLELDINHIDIAPSYGKAEETLGPWLKNHRDHFFLGCKTMERSREGASAELTRSLQKLQTDTFDLYQCHAVTSLDELDAVTSKGGALEAFVAARQDGIIQHIGITSHGQDAPIVLLEALQRYDFASVLFPLNFILFSNPDYRAKATELIKICRNKNVGVMVIKSIAREPWGDKNKTHSTWYRPFTSESEIQKAVHFVLSQDITGICTASDTRLATKITQACLNFKPMESAEQEELILSGREYQSIF